MRFTSGMLIVIAALAGCRNQPTALSNPFLTPDRVPPPSTRVLAPGTAQPYYPGDPLPGAAVAPPAVVAPPAAAYPGATYPQTTPPGGWGAYPPQSQVAPDAVPLASAAAWQPGDVQRAVAEIPSGTPNVTMSAEPVNAPGDQLPLRFPAPADLAPITPTPLTPTPEPAFAPNAGAQLPTAPAAAQTPADGSPQQLQIREVTPAEYLASQPSHDQSQPAPARDGFRPQSSEPRDESPPSQSFRPPEIRRSAVAQSEGVDAYGVGENHQWLRGQLEYWPAAGQWSLRYLPAAGGGDSLGGRVMIDNPQVLANLQPGEFVMVRGQLYAKPTPEGSTAPAYRVAVVQRQRL